MKKKTEVQKKVKPLEHSNSSEKKRKISPKGARQKGLNFERQIANEIGHIFEDAKRHLEFQGDEAQEGMDISGTDVIKIQCKNHQNYVSVSTINEVKVSNDKDIPVLVTKGNKLEAMAILPWRKFVTLLEVVYGLKPRFREFAVEAQQLVIENDVRDIKELYHKVTGILPKIETFLGLPVSTSPYLSEDEIVINAGDRKKLVHVKNIGPIEVVQEGVRELKDEGHKAESIELSPVVAEELNREATALKFF